MAEGIATPKDRTQAGEPGPEKISGGHLVAKALKAEGIDAIFTLCGGHIIDIYDGCIDEGIKIIDVRHEQVAAHAADGYARMTGRPGCAVVTAGPGTTNAITGVANAFRAESPFLLIGGQSALSQHKMGGLQDLPHVDILQPITKFASSVPSTARIADMVSMAFRETMNGAPGPAYLEIPRDVLDAQIDLGRARIPAPGKYRASTRVLGPPDDVERFADLVVKSERPCILLGTQVWTCRAAKAAVEFARKLNVPVYMNGAGRGTLPPGDPHHFSKTRAHAFDKADLIIIVGTPFDFRMGYGRRLNAAAIVVQIDLDYRTIGKNRDIDLGLTGDCGVILAAATAATTGRPDNGAKRRQGWIDELRLGEASGVEKFMKDFMSDATPINPFRVAWELNEFMGEDTIYIGDGGDVVTITAQAVQPRQPGHWMDPGPLGTLGVGVPFALAAKLVHPEKEVLCYFGDGAFAMTGFDMETCVRFKLPFLGVIGNNSSMNQIRYGQVAKYGANRGNIGNKLGDVPFSLFAEMLGGYGEEVREPEQIRPALERARQAVASGVPALVNIWVDPEIYAPGTKNQTMYK